MSITEVSNRCFYQYQFLLQVWEKMVENWTSFSVGVDFIPACRTSLIWRKPLSSGTRVYFAALQNWA